MTTDVETNSSPKANPLGWTATELGPDVSVHMDTAQRLLSMLVAIDGTGNLSVIPDGSVSALAWTIMSRIGGY